jgi:hypothetical protein
MNMNQSSGAQPKAQELNDDGREANGTTASGLVGEQRFTITGGKGRFLGATGSGGWMGSLDANNQVTLVLDGIVTRPKP